MQVVYKVEDSLEKIGLSVSPRKRARPKKAALVAGMEFWHRNILPGHFTRAAYLLYPGAYPKKKKDPLRPLLKTGTLKRRSMSPRNRNKIRGTQKRVSMTINYGRPKQFTEKALQDAVHAEMAISNISFRQAQQRVFSKAGYGERNRRIFTRALQAATDLEAEKIARKQVSVFLEEAQKTGRRKRRRVK